MSGLTHPHPEKRHSVRLPKSASGRRKPTGPIKAPHRHAGFAAALGPDVVVHDADGHGHLRVKPHRGNMLLAFGAVGWAVPIFGVLAFVMGKSDLQHMHMGGMDRAGAGATRTAYWLGAADIAVFCAAVIIAGVVVALTR